MAGIPISGNTGAFPGVGVTSRIMHQHLLDSANKASSNASSWTSAAATSKVAGAVALANQTGGSILGFTYE